MNYLVPLIGLLIAGCGPTFEPAGAARTEPRLGDDVLIARDGARLPLRHWATTADLKGAVVALHSFTDYSAAFEQIGPWLAEQGYDTYAYDQRGFGAAPHPGIWPGTEALVGDLVDAIEAVRDELDDTELPLYVIGESMGGSVAMLAGAELKDDAPAGLILSAPGVRGELPYRSLWDAAFWTAAHLTPALTISPSRDPDRNLVPASAERLRDDALVIRDIRADYYYGVVQLADHASRAASDVRVPVLMLHGGEDDLVKRVSICAAFELIPAPKSLLLYPEAPHLLLHWRGRKRLLDDVGNWLAGEPGRIETDAAC